MDFEYDEIRDAIDGMIKQEYRRALDDLNQDILYYETSDIRLRCSLETLQERRRCTEMFLRDLDRLKGILPEKQPDVAWDVQAEPA